MKPLNRIYQELATIQGIQIIDVGFMIHFLYSSHSYYLYAKRITGLNGGAPAERTRAQLSSSDNFKVLKPSDRFLFMGWDEENDVFTCWDPVNTKARLNQRQTVSLHSRLSAQESVKSGEIAEVRLKTGDQLVLMKPGDLSYFLANIEHYFPTLLLNSVESGFDLWSIADAAAFTHSHSKEALLKAIQVLNDEDITSIICEGIECDYSTFSIVQILSTYQDRYPNMKLSDWKLVVEIAISRTNKKSIIDSDLDNHETDVED